MGKKGRAKLSDADLRAGCREMIEKSIGLPSSEIEAAARERYEAYKDEEKLDREVRDAADTLNRAIREAVKVARRCRQSPYGNSNFVHLVRNFIAPLMKSRHELKRLSWRPQRESRSEITRFVEAVDRTNFLGLIERHATDQEMACLLVVLGLVSLQETDWNWKTSVLGALRRIVTAVRHCRWDEYHGRPALIEKTHQDIANLRRLRD
jgi:hypothetical protein